MRTLFVCAILVFCFFFFATEILACSCKPQSVNFRVKDNDLVFVGKVTKITKISNGEAITFNLSDILKTHFLDIENPTNEVTIFQRTGMDDCAFNFKIGKKYVVFSDSFLLKESPAIKFSTNACSGNEVFSKQFFKQVKKEADKVKKSKVS